MVESWLERATPTPFTGTSSGQTNRQDYEKSETNHLITFDHRFVRSFLSAAAFEFPLAMEGIQEKLVRKVRDDLFICTYKDLCPGDIVGISLGVASIVLGALVSAFLYWRHQKRVKSDSWNSDEGKGLLHGDDGEVDRPLSAL